MSVAQFLATQPKGRISHTAYTTVRKQKTSPWVHPPPPAHRDTLKPTQPTPTQGDATHLRQPSSSLLITTHKRNLSNQPLASPLN